MKLLSQQKMYMWVKSYPDISKTRGLDWLMPSELDDAFQRLVDSTNIGYVLRVNYPDLHKNDDGRWQFEEAMGGKS